MFLSGFSVSRYALCLMFVGVFLLFSSAGLGVFVVAVCQCCIAYLGLTPFLICNRQMSCFFISEKYVHLCWISWLLKLFTYSGDSCTGIVMLIMRYGCHVSELLVFGFSYPSLFLQDIYLKYLGWTLNDKVRDFFLEKEALLILENYIRMIQLY